MAPAYDSIVLTTSLEVDASALERATGWAVKPEGACRGEVCVPLPPEARVDGGRIRLDVVADRLGAPVVHDEDRQLWSMGPATVAGRALASAEAPELELPDVDGNVFRLSSLRGKKVLLVAWASW
jgi:hypothetical protein